jgi:hypothetical protein
MVQVALKIRVVGVAVPLTWREEIPNVATRDDMLRVACRADVALEKTDNAVDPDRTALVGRTNPYPLENSVSEPSTLDSSVDEELVEWIFVESVEVIDEVVPRVLFEYGACRLG